MALKEVETLPQFLHRLLLLQIDRILIPLLLSVLYNLINEIDTLYLLCSNHFLKLRVKYVTKGNRQVIPPHIRHFINHLPDLVPLGPLVVVWIYWTVQGVEDNEIVCNCVVEILQFLQLLFCFNLKSWSCEEGASDHRLSQNHLIFLMS